MSTLITVIHVITCILIVLVVLIQQGKGAEISASFAGSSQTVFGSSGGANFFVRFTQGAALVFFLTSLALTVMKSESKRSVFEQVSGLPASNAASPAGGPAAVPVATHAAPPAEASGSQTAKPTGAAAPAKK